MEGAGRPVVYPPIHEEIDQWGDIVYRVEFSDGQTETIDLGDELPREEAQERVRETLLHGLMQGRYPARDFYRQDPHSVVDDGHGLVEDSNGRQCFGGIPASGEAIVGLPETTVKEGECSVCLEDFETVNKLRMMPCSHAFHEVCIFNWLRLNHVCPLCRFPLPTEQQ